MTVKTKSTRRSFLKRGAILAAPLAAAAPAAIMTDDDLKARLERLENEAAIRALHQRWLRKINSGEAVLPLSRARVGNGDTENVRAIAPDHSAPPDAIEVAAHGGTATGWFRCIVEIETPITQDCTLARMAHAQGSGFVRRTERRLLSVKYLENSGAWSISSAELAAL
jgi:hypothetical protein